MHEYYRLTAKRLGLAAQWNFQKDVDAE